MLTAYEAADGVLIKRDGLAAVTPAIVWVDLFNPTKDEDLLVEQALGIAVPTREEMAEIEASSRLYQEGGAHVMTAIVLHQPDTDERARRSPRRSRSSSPAAGSSPCATRSRAPSDLPRPRAEEGCRAA